jgi:hypothetical protein
MEPDLREVGKDIKRRREDMFRKGHDIPLKTLEDRELEANEWLPLEEVPTEADREFVKANDWNNNEATWEEYETNEWKKVNDEWVRKKDWRIKDEALRKEYKTKSDLVNAYDGKENWRKTRIPPKEYYARVDELQTSGIPQLWLKPQRTGALRSLEAVFPWEFKHLTNEEGQNRKLSIPGKYHISLAYDQNMTDELQTELDEFYEAHFPKVADGEYGWLERSFPNKDDIKVSSGSTYEFRNLDDPFVRALNRLQMLGVGKKDAWAHISLD